MEKDIKLEITSEPKFSARGLNQLEEAIKKANVKKTDKDSFISEILSNIKQNGSEDVDHIVDCVSDLSIILKDVVDLISTLSIGISKSVELPSSVIVDLMIGDLMEEPYSRLLSTLIKEITFKNQYSEDLEKLYQYRMNIKNKLNEIQK